MATGWEIFSSFWVLWKEIFHGSLCPTRHTNCSAGCCKLCVTLACDLNWLRDAVRIHRQCRGAWEKTSIPVHCAVAAVQCLPAGLSPLLGTQRSASHTYFHSTNQGHTWIQQSQAELAANSGSASSHLNFSSSNNLIIFLCWWCCFLYHHKSLFYADDTVFLYHH